MAKFLDPDIKSEVLSLMRQKHEEDAQAVSNLKTIRDGKECFCAEGILCQVAVNHGKGFWAPNDICVATDTINDFSNTFIPDGILTWMFGTDEFGWPVDLSLEYQDQKLRLVYLNDMVCLSLREIADLIEAQM